MKKINTQQIEEIAYSLIVKACQNITEPCKRALELALERETSLNSRFCLEKLLENAKIAKEQRMPVCQDTGMAVFHVKMGHQVIVDGLIQTALDNAVKRAYTENYFRKSVCDPLTRQNTQFNTPAMLTLEQTLGEEFTITFMPKGFGSENMSRLFMLKPAQGIDGVISAVLTAVKDADSRPCPPIYVGVGIGGTFDKCALLAKKALMRPVGENHPRKDVKEIEERLLELINQTEIGVQGLGGNNTALGVAVEVAPTHLAGLPVAVNIQCNCVRGESASL